MSASNSAGTPAGSRSGVLWTAGLPARWAGAPWRSYAGPPARPWAVGHPVHQATDLPETLHETDLLFPTRLPGTGGRKSRMDALTWGSSKTNRELQRLQGWVNSTFTPADGGVAIPQTRSSTCTRRVPSALSRTFIVRRSRGLIAAALQYGHLKTKVALNCAAQGDDSWLDDVAVERLEMVLDQSEDDWTRLEEDNEHVSWPACRRVQAPHRRRSDLPRPQYRPVAALLVEATVLVRWTLTPLGPTAAAAWA
ncbi:hypothetical protein ACWEF9_14305 [Streptomyces sp. NPDC004980]